MGKTNRYAPRGQSLEERMAHYTDRNRSDGCHYWTANKNTSGYGHFDWRGKQVTAHRIAWALRFGPIPPGMSVCHKCDVRHCVNPDHLFLGTNIDNIADRDRKGRHRPLLGSEHGMAILSETDVRAIRASTERGVDLAARYGVYPSRISAIRLRQSWRHLD
jgi:hypothetical protein